MKTGSIVLGLILAFGTLNAAEELSERDKHAVAEADKFVERGNQFEKNGSLPRAKAEYQKALKAFPRHLDALYNLAIACEKLNQRDEAIETYKRYLEIKLGDADVWTQLGVLDDVSGQKAEAQAAYEKALAINPKFGRAQNNLGVLLEEQGKLDDAQKHLEAFVQIEEQAGRPNGDACYSLGCLYLARGRVKDAKILLQKALDDDPSIPYYNNAMGDVYLAEKRPDLALVHYKKAVEKNEKYALPYSGMGDAYRQLKDTDKAAQAYRKALELRPDYALVHYKLGLLYEDSNPGEAIKGFEKYLASGKNLEFQKEATEKLHKLKNSNQAQPKQP
jgi:tetratricopeptide (TPR) repeat protein